MSQDIIAIIKEASQMGAAEAIKRMKPEINITKVVYQYTKEKVLVKIWYGGAKECQKFGFDRGTIGGCCRGELKQHRGYLWSYVPL